MSENKVKVTVADNYPGLTHRGVQVAPGEEIEVWESQAKNLRSIGAINPYYKNKSSRKPAKAEADDPETEADIAAEGDVGSDTITEGAKDS